MRRTNLSPGAIKILFVILIVSSLTLVIGMLPTIVAIWSPDGFGLEQKDDEFKKDVMTGEQFRDYLRENDIRWDEVDTNKLVEISNILAKWDFEKTGDEVEIQFFEHKKAGHGANAFRQCRELMDRPEFHDIYIAEDSEGRQKTLANRTRASGEQNYYVLSRIDNTVIYAKTQFRSAHLLDELIESLGY